jgi:hypothetical protein
VAVAVVVALCARRGAGVFDDAFEDAVAVERAASVWRGSGSTTNGFYNGFRLHLARVGSNLEVEGLFT